MVASHCLWRHLPLFLLHKNPSHWSLKFKSPSGLIALQGWCQRYMLWLQDSTMMTLKTILKTRHHPPLPQSLRSAMLSFSPQSCKSDCNEFSKSQEATARQSTNCNYDCNHAMSWKRPWWICCESRKPLQWFHEITNSDHNDFRKSWNAFAKKPSNS